MQKYFLELSYDGTDFHGWQAQENSNTVQAELENALTTILKNKMQVAGAGRTDTGVHAQYYVAHFEHDSMLENEMDNLVYKLNCLLPKSIAVYNIRKVHQNAHARFDAISRTYKYYISTKKNPFHTLYCYEFYGDLDLESMKKASQVLMEFSDFKSFCKAHSDVKTTICKVTGSYWEKSVDMLIYSIRADRFLRNMVRAIVGTLLEVGRGKLSIEDVGNIVKSGNRSLAGPSAPARGLFLHHIEYPDNIFL